jgi:hypothetical protein
MQPRPKEANIRAHLRRLVWPIAILRSLKAVLLQTAPSVLILPIRLSPGAAQGLPASSMLGASESLCMKN